MQSTLFDKATSLQDPLLLKLSQLRRELANREKVEIYKIWSNQTMTLLCEAKPQTLKALGQIKGIGSKKLKLFGQELLQLFSPDTRKLDQPEPGFLPQDTSIHASPPDGIEKLLGVSDYLDYINEVLKITPDIKVIGEISRLSQHPTGVYLTLKDKTGDGVLDCYINPYTYRGLGMQLEEGMEIKISGTPGIFKRRSQLSFKVEKIELAGEGTLKKAYELLKLKLEQEGLFDRKRDLPEFITTIGIITSKTGAVIDDFRNNLEQLGYNLYFTDCRVEGNQAGTQICKAVQYFNLQHPNLDCIVIMRGGGSLEDLQAFNNEAVIKEIFASRIPIIAAIGHDRDVPLACLVADQYTSTPTAAAILINKSWSRFQTQLPKLERSLLRQFELTLETQRNRLINLTHQLTGSFNTIFHRFNYLSEKIMRGAGQFEMILHETKQKTSSLLNHCISIVQRQLQHNQDKIESIEKLLNTANPERNLRLGYSLAYDASGSLLRTSAQVVKGTHIKVQLHKGSIDTEVINTHD